MDTETIKCKILNGLFEGDSLKLEIKKIKNCPPMKI